MFATILSLNKLPDWALLGIAHAKLISSQIAFFILVAGLLVKNLQDLLFIYCSNSHYWLQRYAKQANIVFLPQKKAAVACLNKLLRLK